MKAGKQDKQAHKLREAIASGDFASARELLASRAVPSATQRSAASPAMSLEEACGVRARSADVGGRKVRYFSRRIRPVDFLPQCIDVEREYTSVLRGARQRFDELAASPALCHAADSRPEDLLFVAAEMCGPAAPWVCLAGVMFCEGSQLVVEQYLARDEGQEPGILQAFAERHAACGVVVTYSGRRSTYKLLRDRCEQHGVDLTAEAWDAPAGRVRAGGPAHLELRRQCRQRWKGTLRGSGILPVEQTLLGRHRKGMMARTAVGQAYRDFLATGSAARIPEVLRHNALDLVTMAQLVCLLLTSSEGVHGQ